MKEITTADAIAWFERRKASITMRGASNMYDKAIAALRTQADAEKNDPLTLDELRAMAEDPVYVVYADGSECWRIAGHFSIYAGMDVLCWRDDSVSYRPDFETIRDYGKTWTAYRQKPKEGANRRTETIKISE